MTLGTTSAKFLCGYCHAEYDTPEEVRECAVQRHGQKRTTSAIDLVERVARAICEAHAQQRWPGNEKAIRCQVENGWDLWEREARAAIEVQSDTITRLQAALKPFVRHYEFKWMDERPDDAECCIYSRVTYGQLREAVAALRSSVGGE